MPSPASPLLIWTGGACVGPPGYGYGGWAWLIIEGDIARGAAGGERHTTAGRMALRAVIEALAAVAAARGAAVDLYPGEAGLVRLGVDLSGRRAAGWLTPAGEAIDHPDLWEQAAAITGARSGPLRFLAEPAAPAKADARVFVDAWTAFASDKTKAKGPFTSPIPKPNLLAFLAKRR